jgi:endonuclease YncB( thermonuclease family)
MSRRARVLIVVVVAFVASGLGWWFGAARRAADTPYRVVDVLDGDTIVVRRVGGGDETVRMLGIDTPETRHPSRPVECFGPEASAFTSRRLYGRVVTLEDDVEGRDVYDRRLAYVYVDAELAAEQHARGLWDACESST